MRKIIYYDKEHNELSFDDFKEKALGNKIFREEIEKITQKVNGFFDKEQK